MKMTTTANSSIYPRYDTADYSFDFDPEVDFSQFLSEARQHKTDSNILASSPNVELEGKRRSGDEKRGKKSWKRSLFSWCRSEKKANRPRVEPATDVFHKPRPQRGYTSGPILDSSARGGGGGAELLRHYRPTSGPLSGLFGKGKRSESETSTPYVTLGGGQNGRSNGAATSPYGPVYLVT
ncbi:hypothetical protein SAY87_018264 [Trapa incisa]|uniref:Uncharacterized protein n=1 Tax=Trapa incisa TaxID=236973 RepID=A0AAN7L259_9MYRT|nr:hypothetical protein SAY87_018264 [Trapa incisa]